MTQSGLSKQARHGGTPWGTLPEAHTPGPKGGLPISALEVCCGLLPILPYTALYCPILPYTSLYYSTRAPNPTGHIQPYPDGRFELKLQVAIFGPLASPPPSPP